MGNQERKSLTWLPKSTRLSLAVFGTGIASGLVGILCHYLLEFIQILVFGNDKSNLLSQFNYILVLMILFYVISSLSLNDLKLFLTKQVANCKLFYYIATPFHCSIIFD